MVFEEYSLGDVGEIVSGATPKTFDESYFGGDIAWITPADLSGYTDKYISHGARNLTLKGYESCSTRLMPKGTVLFTSRAPIGYVAIAANDICTNQGFKSIIPNSRIIESEFLYYQLFSLRDEIQNRGTGTTFKEISSQKMKEIIIRVPSLENQRKIVSRIEELLSQLEASEATLRTIKDQLALYRQAVLKDAFSEEDNWPQCKLIDLLQSMRNGYGLKPSDSGKYRILRISSVRPMCLNLSDCRYNIKQFSEEDTIEENDILFTRYNGSEEYVGVCAYVPHITDRYAYPDKIIRCRLKKPVDSVAKFLCYYLNTGKARKYIRSKIKTTSGQKGISGLDLKNTLIRMPCLDTCVQIVNYIDSRLSACEIIEREVNHALIKTHTMRQSILKQAFEGEVNT
ncbi:MAG: restriction endonuclease subunit S [Anaerolineaceae bacterium]|nr:restriction endonuclease subunit S [Anaerolineaceae bacterium]